jgi:hypothetical protein
MQVLEHALTLDFFLLPPGREDARVLEAGCGAAAGMSVGEAVTAVDAASEAASEAAAAAASDSLARGGMGGGCMESDGVGTVAFAL